MKTTSPTAKSDPRLVAAAPSLLAICVEIHRVMRDVAWFAPLEEKLAAAIAEAKGEDSTPPAVANE